MLGVASSVDVMIEIEFLETDFSSDGFEGETFVMHC